MSIGFLLIPGRNRRAGFTEFFFKKRETEFLMKGKFVEPEYSPGCDSQPDLYFVSDFETIIDSNNRSEIIHCYDNMVKNDPECITDLNSTKIAEEIRNLIKNEQARL